jgi:sulfur-oxidizing protein SoxY
MPARRRACIALLASLALGAAVPVVAAPDTKTTTTDPFNSLPWEDLKREYLGKAPAVFDERVQVQGPAFAEDPMNVPISLRVDPALGPIAQIVVMVDRNPIRRVLEYFPMQALPVLSFRFKLEQA